MALFVTIIGAFLGYLVARGVFLGDSFLLKVPGFRFFVGLM